MKLWVGVDPGNTGAVAAIDPNSGVVFFDTPTVKVGTKNLPHIAAMAGIIRTLAAENGANRVHVVVESVHSMPKQGVASSFNFGKGFGAWLGILAALEIPYTLVDPRRWTGTLLRDMPKGDEAAIIRASELYPAVAGELRTPRGRLLLGRADALLLAHFGKASG
jgi:hypothetical protein